MDQPLFLRACRGEPVPRTPIWIMRQAGRYLPEYREVRSRADFLTLCKTPELAARVTLQPIERFGMDAAILFSDILIPAEALGLRFDFNPGPVLEHPLRDAAAIRGLAVADPLERVPYVFETVRILRRELADRTPLIGFAAAPLTLAVYLVEGGGSKSFEHIKGLLYGDPAAGHELLEKIARLTASYLRGQIAAGPRRSSSSIPGPACSIPRRTRSSACAGRGACSRSSRRRGCRGSTSPWTRTTCSSRSAPRGPT